MCSVRPPPPTKLLFNVSTPGALLRYRCPAGRGGGTLTRQLIAGTPARCHARTLLRVYLAPEDRILRLLAAAVLLPLGIWLCTRRRTFSQTAHDQPSDHHALGVAVGVVGGIYGTGGGSLPAPILVGAGLPVTAVAPAALAATLLTSEIRVSAYSLLSLISEGPLSRIGLGLLCGLGGLLGGYLGHACSQACPRPDFA